MDNPFVRPPARRPSIHQALTAAPGSLLCRTGPAVPKAVLLASAFAKQSKDSETKVDSQSLHEQLLQSTSTPCGRKVDEVHQHVVQKHLTFSKRELHAERKRSRSPLRSRSSLSYSPKFSHVRESIAWE